MRAATPADPLDTALRALRTRDHSAASLDERLAGRGFDAAERAEVIERLRELGYVDDARFARLRAESLAARGSGDRLIDADLARHGVDRATREAALESLEPEDVRAAAIVARRGASPKVARLLVGRGFAEDTVERAVARVPGDD